MIDIKVNEETITQPFNTHEQNNAEIKNNVNAIDTKLRYIRDYNEISTKKIHSQLRCTNVLLTLILITLIVQLLPSLIEISALLQIMKLF